jgi:flavin-binding protein dodecin
MGDSVYVVNEIVGTSTVSWEAAAKSAIETAAKSVKDLRIGEVVTQDVTLENGKVVSYRVRLNISFKYHPDKVWHEEIRKH